MDKEQLAAKWKEATSFGEAESPICKAVIDEYFDSSEQGIEVEVGLAALQALAADIMSFGNAIAAAEGKAPVTI